MKISEFRERMRAYVTGDQSSLDDEEWWAQTTELSLLVLAERARVKRERGLANLPDLVPAGLGEVMEENFSEWTWCEFYGHEYRDVEDRPNVRRCNDCGDEY